jgi:Predicted hydrolases or acyltransferases (alpha/beta hydrolase superfamily)
MAVEKFHIQVEEKVLNDLRAKLGQVRWPDQMDGTEWEQGTELGYLQSLVAYWRDSFNWRQQEAELNRLAHFRSEVDGLSIHFIHERGVGPSPLPIILTHGWPDSFTRYQKIIPLLTDPASHGGDPMDSFDVIVPSIPGFGFSSRPNLRGVNSFQVAELWAKLMTKELGYPRFAAAGGDIGSGVTRYLAAAHPELLVGIHLTDIGILRDLLAPSGRTDLTEGELRYRSIATEWIAREGAYMSLQSTKPQTLAYGLSDSPVGLAGWIVEKFRTWSDCGGDLGRSFTKDELLTNIMIYWLTGTIGSSTRMYYENSHTLPPLGHIDVPTGIALFPADILLPPQECAERRLNIARWTTMPRGGHFAAMEEPELLADEIRAFFRPLRS